MLMDSKLSLAIYIDKIIKEGNISLEFVPRSSKEFVKPATVFRLYGTIVLFYFYVQSSRASSSAIYLYG